MHDCLEQDEGEQVDLMQKSSTFLSLPRSRQQEEEPNQRLPPFRSYGILLLEPHLERGLEDLQEHEDMQCDFDYLHVTKKLETRTNVSVLLRCNSSYREFQLLPCTGLPPPGNPMTLWMTFDWNTMDQLHHAGEHVYVTDYKSPDPRPIATPARNVLQLAPLIEQCGARGGLPLNECTRHASEETEFHHESTSRKADEPSRALEAMLILGPSKADFETFLQFWPNDDKLYKDFELLGNLKEVSKEWLEQHQLPGDKWDFSKSCGSQCTLTAPTTGKHPHGPLQLLLLQPKLNFS